MIYILITMLVISSIALFIAIKTIKEYDERLIKEIQFNEKLIKERSMLRNEIYR